MALLRWVVGIAIGNKRAEEEKKMGEVLLVSAFLYIPVYSQGKGPVKFLDKKIVKLLGATASFLSGAPRMIAVTETCPHSPQPSTLNISKIYL